MAVSLLDEPPRIARIGFDHGWHLTGPTFLNLGIPVLLVDQLFVGDPGTYRLEVLGGRNPRTPLPTSNLTVQWSGRFVALYAPHHAEPLAIGAFADPSVLRHLDRTRIVAVAVGDTWAIEQSWCALFRAAIGIAAVQRFGQPSG